MLTKGKSFAGLAVILLVVAGTWGVLHYQRPSAIEESSEILARVDDQIISKADFIREMGLRGGRLPGQYQTVEQRRALLDVMLERKAMLHAASEAGYDKDPVIVKQIENMMIQKFTQETIQAHLSAVSVSDEEVETFYQSRRKEYARPARRQVALIEIPLPKNVDEQAIVKARSKAERALAEVSTLDPKINHFGALARQYSDDRASRYRGGVISWIIDHPSRTYQWDDAVLSAAFELEKPGDLSSVIQTDSGFYLVRLVRSEPAREQRLEQLHDGIANRLLQDKRKIEKARILAELQDGLNITVDQQLLSEIQPISAPAKLLATSKPPAMP